MRKNTFYKTIEEKKKKPDPRIPIIETHVSGSFNLYENKRFSPKRDFFSGIEENANNDTNEIGLEQEQYLITSERFIELMEQ